MIQPSHIDIDMGIYTSDLNIKYLDVYLIDVDQ